MNWTCTHFVYPICMHNQCCAWTHPLNDMTYLYFNERELNVLFYCQMRELFHFGVCDNDTLSQLMFVQFGARFQAKTRLKHTATGFYRERKNALSAHTGQQRCSTECVIKAETAVACRSRQNSIRLGHEHFNLLSFFFFFFWQGQCGCKKNLSLLCKLSKRKFGLHSHPRQPWNGTSNWRAVFPRMWKIRGNK